MTATIHRIDQYTITIDGIPVRATEHQEHYIRALDDDGLTQFLHIMGTTQ